MTTHLLTPNPAPMVPADSVAVSLYESFTVARRSKEQKAAGLSTGMVKAEGFARQGTSAALMVALGVNGKANKALVLAQSLHGLTRGDQVAFAVAIPQVLAVAETTYTYGVDIHADGTRHAVRKDWLALRTMLEGVLADGTTAKAKAKRFTRALALWDSIQAAADAKRATLPAPATDSAPTPPTE